MVPLKCPKDFEKACTDGPERDGVVAVVDEPAYMNVFVSTGCQFSTIGQEFTGYGWDFKYFFFQDTKLLYGS